MTSAREVPSIVSAPLVPTIVAIRPEQRTAPSTFSITGVGAFTGSRTGSGRGTTVVCGGAAVVAGAAVVVGRGAAVVVVLGAAVVVGRGATVVGRGAAVVAVSYTHLTLPTIRLV